MRGPPADSVSQLDTRIRRAKANRAWGRALPTRWNFPPVLGTFGAASRRDGSLSKLLQHYEIGHDQCWAGPSKNRLRMGAAEVPYQFPPIVHYLTWLRRHQHQIGCAV